MSDNLYLWADLETTGLDEHNDCILEFAVALVNDGRNGDMSIVETFDSVVLPSSVEAFESMDQYVVQMHTKSGLLAALDSDQAITLEEAEAFLCTLIPEGHKAVLAGNSVHFDLAFYRAHMPAFAKRLSHRVLDVSTLKQIEKEWGDSASTMTPPGVAAHRALDDVKESIASAKAYRARRYDLPGMVAP